MRNDGNFSEKSNTNYSQIPHLWSTQTGWQVTNYSRGLVTFHVWMSYTTSFSGTWDHHCIITLYSVCPSWTPKTRLRNIFGRYILESNKMYCIDSPRVSAFTETIAVFLEKSVVDTRWTPVFPFKEVLPA